MNKEFYIAALLILTSLLLAGCGEDFDQASRIQSMRFLGVVADPPEAAPGEQITFSALVTNKDGSLYEGPVAWVIVGGDMLRTDGEENIDPSSVYLQMPGGPEFVWTVPAEDKLAANFGKMQKNGMLITVLATAFEGGDLEGATRSAYKLFVVSNRPEEVRFTNPIIDNLQVTNNAGDELATNADGEYIARGDKAKIHAVFSRGGDELSYHWFSTFKDFISDFESTQTIDPDKKGVYPVYFVARQSWFFQHDDNSSTRVTGMDWQSVRVRFE